MTLTLGEADTRGVVVSDPPGRNRLGSSGEEDASRVDPRGRGRSSHVDLRAEPAPAAALLPSADADYFTCHPRVSRNALSSTASTS